MRTLVAMLRLVRLPLLFTALADVSVIPLLSAGGTVPIYRLGWLWLAAAGVYVFGMAGNDLFDRNRDRLHLAEGRGGRVNPVASGELSARAAGAVVLGGAAMALLAAALSPAVNHTVTIFALAMALLYNAGAKAYPPLGLALLGGVRAANAAQGLSGEWAMEWWAVPAIIGAHVMIVSAVAYRWEGKRPALDARGMFYLLAIAAVALVNLTVAASRLGATLWKTGPISLPIGAILLFWALFSLIRPGKSHQTRAVWLILTGLSWLIVLDAVFVLAGGFFRSAAGFAPLMGAVWVTWVLLRRGASRGTRHGA